MESLPTSVEFRCEYCGKTFSRKSTLTLHIPIHTGDWNLRCNICLKGFSSMSKLTRHKVTHTGECDSKCSICEKGFSQKSDLVRHMVTHSEVKDFKYNECGKCFYRKWSLTTHMARHSNEIFRCDVCGSEFSQHSSLRRYMFVHAGVKNFKCDICEKVFPQKNKLARHMVIHTGDGKFKCSICDKGFAQKSDYTRHMVTHTGEGSFKCNVCKKGFYLKSYLTRHMVIHTGVKSFNCEICGKGYAKSISLEKHMTKHSPVKESGGSETEEMPNSDACPSGQINKNIDRISEMESDAVSLFDNECVTVSPLQIKKERNEMDSEGAAGVVNVDPIKSHFILEGQESEPPSIGDVKVDPLNAEYKYTDDRTVVYIKEEDPNWDVDTSLIKEEHVVSEQPEECDKGGKKDDLLYASS